MMFHILGADIWKALVETEVVMWYGCSMEVFGDLEEYNYTSSHLKNWKLCIVGRH